MKAIYILLLSLVVSAFASGGMGGEPSLKYADIAVSNLTGATITDVVVQVGESGHRTACASVLNNEQCQQYFAPKPYPNQPIQLNWTGSDGSPQSKQFSPELDPNFPPGIALQILININGDGTTNIKLKGS